MSLFVSFTVTPMLARPEVTEVFSSVGVVTGSVSGTSNNSNLAEVTVTLNDKKKRNFTASEFGVDIQKQLSAVLPGVKITAAATSISGGGNQTPIQIAIKGTDLKTIRTIADEYKKLIATVPGTQFVELSVKNRCQRFLRVDISTLPVEAQTKSYCFLKGLIIAAYSYTQKISHLK